jgi:hypothetical protein
MYGEEQSMTVTSLPPLFFLPKLRNLLNPRAASHGDRATPETLARGVDIVVVIRASMSALCCRFLRSSASSSSSSLSMDGAREM